ncbi:unnamed protein product [Rhizophagus irregularis]|nr:unnamed protein product [Rhizophagus irregularis]
MATLKHDGSFEKTLIKNHFNCSPELFIRDDMKKTSLCIQQELETHHHKYPIGCSESYFESKINELTHHNEIVTFGVLLPITSRELTKPEKCIENFSNLLKSLAETSQQDIQYRISGTRYQIKIYIGIDKDGHLFLNNSAEKIFYNHGFIDIDITKFDYFPGSTCDIWRELSRKAYKENWDYIVLFENDIIIKTNGWMNKFHKTYLEISIQKKVPCNFGCVTFTDITFPGFPAFPVISRVHLDTFNGDIIPQQKFQIQDVYTYLFQLYRRWGCSIILHDVEIQKIDVDQRYEKWYHSDWKFDVLNNSVDRVEKWLNNNNKTPIQKLLTLDIVVPSYRVDFKYLDPIINLEIPVTMSTIIYIIIDDPNSSNIILLKKLYEKDPFIRILVNKPNLGASLSRNRGLYESNADYILFLDDDVTPEKDILFECEKVIKEHPTACGFIGSSKFPPANESIFKSAVVLSGVTFFWEIAEIWDNDIPWGIAGNLLIRSYKDDILFDSSFPKTGGGEDIDFCLKKGNFFIKNVENGKGFQGAPNVKVTHHWWNDGKRYYWRFYKWAKGDGALIKMHPNLTYNDIVPNSAEFLLGTTFILFITVIISSLITVFYDIEIINIFTILIFLSVPHVIISNFIFDIHLHLIIQPFKRVPTIRGYRYILAIFESSMIRMTNEFGRLMGHIERKEWNYIGKRFDWFAKKNGGTMNDEISTNSRKFFIWVSLMVFSSSVLLIVISESPM